jgi:hypothetical protein
VLLFPIVAKTGGLFSAGDGPVAAGVRVVGAFVTVIVIVWELSVVLTATLTWLPGAVEVLETVPLKGHTVCTQNKAPKMLSVLKIFFTVSAL